MLMLTTLLNCLQCLALLFATQQSCEIMFCICCEVTSQLPWPLMIIQQGLQSPVERNFSHCAKWWSGHAFCWIPEVPWYLLNAEQIWPEVWQSDKLVMEHTITNMIFTTLLCKWQCKALYRNDHSVDMSLQLCRTSKGGQFPCLLMWWESTEAVTVSGTYFSLIPVNEGEYYYYCA